MENAATDVENMETAAERVKRLHDYSKQHIDEHQFLLDSPSNSPLKKITRREDQDGITNATLLAAINKIGQNQDSLLEKLQSIEKCVNDNTDAIRTLSISFKDVQEQVGGLSSNIAVLEQKVLSLTKENVTLREQINEIDAYKRRWNLKISGIPE